MIGHEHPGMHVNPELRRKLLQPAGISGKVLIRTKADLPVIAALDDVLRDAGQADARESGQVHLPRMAIQKLPPILARITQGSGKPQEFLL